jgi:hypothetical protein
MISGSLKWVGWDEQLSKTIGRGKHDICHKKPMTILVICPLEQPAY